MTDSKSLMEFPCNFPIKIIGKNEPSFINEIVAITRQHFPTLKDSDVTSQPSKQGTYLALSITVQAHNQAGLDALYLDLTKHPDIKMVL